MILSRAGLRGVGHKEMALGTGKRSVEVFDYARRFSLCFN